MPLLRGERQQKGTAVNGRRINFGFTRRKRKAH